MQRFFYITTQIRMGDRLQKLICLLPNEVSLANLNLSGSTLLFSISISAHKRAQNGQKGIERVQ